MNKTLIAFFACVVAILTVVLAMFFLDFSFMSECKKICGMSRVKDITENKRSSFAKDIVDYKKMTLKDEDCLEDEECKIVEDFEFNCNEKDEIEKPEEKPECKPNNAVDKCNTVTNNTVDNNQTETNKPEQKPENKPSAKWGITLGDYNGLTYYSQIDERWKDNLYSSTGNPSQTIGSSGCGPAVIAMVVSSIKGDVNPAQIAEALVKNGYRSANNGTYWSAFRAAAEEFGINYKETSNFDKALDLLRNNYYVIVSCGNGLFTTGGHYVVLVGIEGNTLKIYDPYLYANKFNTPNRRGKVVVEGNTVYCTIENFRKYSAYKSFFCYQNEHKM